MILSIRYAGQAAIVNLSGRLTLNPAVNQIKSRIEALLNKKPATGLVLDLAAVPAMDSAGIGELMKIHAFARRRGIRMALVHVNPRIAEMLKITRLDGLLSVCGDEISALQRVAQPELAD